MEEIGAFLKTLQKNYKEEMMSFCEETKQMKKDLVRYLEEKHEEAIQKKQSEMEALLLKKETEFQENMSEALDKCCRKERELELALHEERHRVAVLDSNSRTQIQEIKQELQEHRFKVVKAKELAKEQLQEMKKVLETNKVKVIKTQEAASGNKVLKVMEEEIRKGENETSSVLFLLKNILLISESTITSLDTSLRQKESEISSLYTVIKEMMSKYEEKEKETATYNSPFVMWQPNKQVDPKSCICTSKGLVKWSSGDKCIIDKYQKENKDTVGVNTKAYEPKKTLVLPKKEKEGHQSAGKNDFLGYVAASGQLVLQVELKRAEENMMNFKDAEGKTSTLTSQALENKTESSDPNLLPKIDGREEADMSLNQGNTNDLLILKKVNRQGTAQRRSQLRSYHQYLKKRVYKR